MAQHAVEMTNLTTSYPYFFEMVWINSLITALLPGELVLLHVETKQEVGKSLDYTDYSDIIETGQPLGSKFVGKQGRCNRNGIS